MKKILKIFDYFFIGFSFLASKKIVVILMVVGFIYLLNLSASYREELILKENDIIFEKGNPEISYYNEDVSQLDYENNFAITDYFDCYQEGVDVSQVPENVSKYIFELRDLYNENEQYYSFFYQDLFSGFTVSYNENAPIFTASSIKAPAVIYFYEMASKGQIDLNERLVYTGNFYSGGSGILKNKEVNTSYTIEELIYYTIHYSDNIAYMMLMNRFSRGDILSFWSNLGTKSIFTMNSIWGITSTKDASIYMKDLK